MFVNMFRKICRPNGVRLLHRKHEGSEGICVCHSFPPFLFRLKLRRRTASPQYRCRRFQGYAKKIEARRSGFDLESSRDNAIK